VTSTTLQASLNSPVSTAHESATTEGRAGAGFWLGVALLVAVQVVLTNQFVPAHEVFSQRPLQGVDYDLHIGQVYRVVDALEHWGKSWLYDVELLAGQPEGTITDSGSKGWELWTFLLYHFGVPKPIAFNSFVLIVMLIAPWLLYAAARSFKLDAYASLLAAAMTSTLWFFDSHIHWLWFVGMVSWAGASCLAVLTLGLFYRTLEHRHPGLIVGCGLALGAVLLIHPYTFFVLAPPMAVLYLRAFRNMHARDHWAVAAIIACSLAMNAYWLLNAFSHWHYILDSAFYAQASPRFLLCDFFDVLCSGADTGVIGTRTGFRFLYLALAVAGLYIWRREHDARFLPFVIVIGTLAAIAYFGGFIPGMQQTQPYRQITPAILFTTLPAASFAQRLFRECTAPGLQLTLRALLLALGFALTQQLIAGQVLYFLPRWVPDPVLHPDGTLSPLSKYGFFWQSAVPSHLVYSVPHDPNIIEYGAQPTIDWLNANLPPKSRVLVESSVLGERIAWKTEFEVLGGFFERNITHVDANYFREHRTYAATPPDLLHYLRTLAVDCVISNRPEFTRLPNILKPVAVVATRSIYRVDAGIDRVLHGGGHVSAGQNRIEVHASDSQQALVLSYHWHEALRCKPNCRVEREPIDIDRVGFIRVPAPHPANIVVWNSYESW
jgi:hypothetical protein